MHLDTCVHCLVDKQLTISFARKASLRKSNILDLIHSDVYDSMKDKTLGGNLYFVTFVDDHNRKLWVYL